MRENKDKVLLSEPPRLLLGITFLFWGAMHDRPVAALIAAILVEGRHWTKLRWNFKEKGFARSWQLSAVILIGSAIGLLQKDVLRGSDFINLLSWLPFMMLPLILAQQYTKVGGIPIVTFSFIARRKLVADRKAGRPVDNSSIQLGYPFMILIVSAAGLGVGSVQSPGSFELRYAIGVAVLLGWSLYKLRERSARPMAWGAAYLSSIAVALLISWGLYSVYEYYLKSLSRGGSRQPSAMETQTSMGEVGKLQQNHKVLWQYFHEKGEVPKLLKLGSYNQLFRDVWQARTRRLVKEEIKREFGGDFEMFIEDGNEQFIFHEEDQSTEVFELEGRLVGMISEETLIPHARKTKRYENVPADVLGANSYGAVQMIGVNQGAMEARMFSDETAKAIELDPTTLDLTYPEKEEKGVSEFLRKIGFEPPGDGGHPKQELSNWVSPQANPANVSLEEFREIEGRLASEFEDHFNYTLRLNGRNSREPITQFLNKTKEGHCEYFAGSTAILLRRMGIPTRYTVGFSVSERGGDDEWILRAKHVHAWAEAYVGGTWVNEPMEGVDVWRCRGGEWVDVDLTPPDWLEKGSDRPWYQGLSDWFQKTRAGLVLWFARPSVFDGFKVVVMIVVPLFVIYLVYQLVKTRGREASDSWEEAIAKSGLLKEFEQWLSRKVGPRPRSMPMGTWLRRHLPVDVVGLADSYEAATYREDTLTAEELRREVEKAKLSLKTRKNPGTTQVAGFVKDQQGD